MKICVSATGFGLDAPVDERFGRADRFVLVETDTMEATNLENVSAGENHGAGVQAAMAIASAGAEVLITGHCGPKALEVLRAAGIRVYNGARGTVRQSIQAFLDGKLTRANGPGEAR